MCGRYLFSEKSESDIVLSTLNELSAKSLSVKTGTVVPGDTAAVLACDRRLQHTVFPMRWGYKMADGKLLFNARSETAAEKPLFSDGIHQRRCLIPADTYYEWEKTSTGKQKYAISPSNSNGFYLAGIYRIAQGYPEFSILTREPAQRIAFIHNRMPVILPIEAADDWLNPRYAGSEILNAAVLDMRFIRETDDMPQQMTMNFRFQ